MGIHDGHRQRLRKRFVQCGLNGMDDHNVLEIVLFYALPRRDTNELAHRLIERFGSISGVLEAEIDDLKQIDGLGDNAAILLKLFTQVNKRYLEQKSACPDQIKGSKAAGRYFIAKFAYEADELAYAMFLDNSNGITACREVGRGVVNATEIGVRGLVESALRCKASSVILAHNHPGGAPNPSLEDELCTKNIKNALELVGITLLDHIVVAGNAYISMSELGMLR